jgi:hypothetical protein
MISSPMYGEDQLAQMIREEIEGALRGLLALIAGRGTCKGCGAPIYWVKHVGKVEPVPYSSAGINHFIDCPEAKLFRKRERI